MLTRSKEEIIQKFQSTQLTYVKDKLLHMSTKSVRILQTKTKTKTKFLRLIEESQICENLSGQKSSILWGNFPVQIDSE